MLGVLTKEAESYVFEAYDYVVCGSAYRMVREQVDFDLRPVPMPGFSEDSDRPFTNGVKLVALVDSAAGTALFVHYDGYDVRRFAVATSGASWTMSQKMNHVHETRGDLSVPAE